MPQYYFKVRKVFDLRPHPFAIGTIKGVPSGYEDNHFLLKIYGLKREVFGDYYQYHLEYYLSGGNRSEKEFFSHVWHIVSDRIDYFKGQSPYSSKHPLYVSNIGKLNEFLDFLAPLDKWNIRPNDILIKEKDEEISKLRTELETLQKKLADLEKYEVSVKPMVQDDHLPTFIDLLQQMKNLTLPNGRKLLVSDYESPYYKMVSKYFVYNGKDIPVNTVRNYFVQKDPKDSMKGVKIPDYKKLFKIIPIKQG
ncbi:MULTISPECIES: TMF family protein [Sphingobacterium]|uniref:TMF family protein n=1 Tax=Sphingobacterium TaxID=28453 RepID=UPI0013E44585|nr:TMF family protein [Sphingobacterium sp. DR205]QIH31501.1 TMF family protein [Sphingobacterium sp. DR205]